MPEIGQMIAQYRIFEKIQGRRINKHTLGKPLQTDEILDIPIQVTERLET